MDDLPTRGRCHAVFLLAFSARLRKCNDLPTWIAAAQDKPTYMAVSLDLSGTAKLLLDAGLARIDEIVTMARSLGRLDREADLATLKGIARLLLKSRPPAWLRAVVVDGCLATEFIPEQDLRSISWLGDDLEEIIIAAHREVYETADDKLRKLLGDAGELAAMSALIRDGQNPRHVSLISDHFGYDIELRLGADIYGLEIKSAVTATASRVLITRNEFETGKRMGHRWKLVQVIFSSRVIAIGRVTAADIEGFRELSSDMLLNMAPVEKEKFRWIETAEVRPFEGEWTSTDYRVAEDFEANLTDQET